MKSPARFFAVALFLSGPSLTPAAPLSTVENSTLSAPAASIAAVGIAGATNLSGTNFMISAVAPSSQRGGNASLVSSQPWVSRYNDFYGSVGSGNAIGVRADGTIVVTGTSVNPAYNYDFVTICYAPDGTTLWTNRYDGPNSGDDTAQFLATSASGDVWVSGASMRNHGDYYLYDAAIIRYSSDGSPIWTNRYSSFNTNSTYPTALAADNLGNAYLEITAVYWGSNGVGSTMENAIVKYDPLGNVLWVKHYLASGINSGENLCQPAQIALDNAGNLFVAGTTGSISAYPGGDAVNDTGVAVLKLAGDGSEAWTNYMANPVMNLTRSLLADGNGNLVLTGESPSNGTTRYVVSKCSINGTALWTNTVTGPNYDGGGVPETVLDSAGNVLLIAGSPGTASGFYQIEKLNTNGIPLWTNQNANFGSNAMIYASAADSAGNLYLVGQAPPNANGDTDYITTKYSALGQAVWTNRYEGLVGDEDCPFAVAVDGSGGVYITGGISDLTVVKYADRLLYTPPWNFTGSDTISYTLTDTSGNSATGSLAVVVVPGAFGFNPVATKSISGVGYQVQLTGVPGTNPVVLEASPDLVNWQPILTNEPVGGSVQFLDSAAPGLPARFYRAFQQE